MIKIIAAVNNLNFIGKNNNLIFTDKTDMQHFKNTTTGGIVVMGYNTFLSLNSKPLPNRLNIVLTNKDLYNLSTNQLVFTNSIDFVLDLAIENDVWIIGGGEIYKQFINYCQELVLTEVDDNTVGDVLFPQFNKADYTYTLLEKYDKFRIGVYSKRLL